MSYTEMHEQNRDENRCPEYRVIIELSEVIHEGWEFCCLRNDKKAVVFMTLFAFCKPINKIWDFPKEVESAISVVEPSTFTSVPVGHHRTLVRIYATVIRKHVTWVKSDASRTGSLDRWPDNARKTPHSIHYHTHATPLLKKIKMEAIKLTSNCTHVHLV